MVATQRANLGVRSPVPITREGSATGESEAVVLSGFDGFYADIAARVKKGAVGTVSLALRSNGNADEVLDSDDTGSSSYLRAILQSGGKPVSLVLVSSPSMSFDFKIWVTRHRVTGEVR